MFYPQRRFYYWKHPISLLLWVALTSKLSGYYIWNCQSTAAIIKSQKNNNSNQHGASSGVKAWVTSIFWAMRPNQCWLTEETMMIVVYLQSVTPTPSLTPLVHESPTFSWTQVLAMKIMVPAVSSRLASASSIKLGSYSFRMRQYLASGGHREGDGGCLLQWDDSAVLHWLQYRDWAVRFPRIYYQLEINLVYQNKCWQLKEQSR